ncbi:hypothetical protein VULLAG_LOCUS4192 [Vulpes lagopus]
MGTSTWATRTSRQTGVRANETAKKHKMNRQYNQPK